METKKILLDKIKIEDDLDLTANDMVQRAMDIMSEKTELHNWAGTILIFSGVARSLYTKEYEFEIWGHEQEKEQNSEKVVDKL